jgi:hypothetical protein
MPGLSHPETSEMSRGMEPTVSLVFQLDVEDDWPPVAVESLPFRVAHEGYVAMVPPLFVKELSVGDVIDVTHEAGSGRVLSWRHVKKSGRSTIWLLRLKPSNAIETALAALRGLGCNTVGLEDAGVYSVEVPESLPMEAVDAVLGHLDSDSVAVAFPSMRHQEKD